MEIILKEDIIGLGYKNDIVNVKNGYGRNYLIPRERASSLRKVARRCSLRICVSRLTSSLL